MPKSRSGIDLLPNVADTWDRRFEQSEFFEVGAKRDGLGQKLIALARVAGDYAKRELNHVGGFQLGGGDVLEHVGRIL